MLFLIHTGSPGALGLPESSPKSSESPSVAENWLLSRAFLVSVTPTCRRLLCMACLSTWPGALVAQPAQPQDSEP